MRLAAAIPAGRPAPANYAARSGDVEVSGKDWVMSALNPFYHCERLSTIEEDVDYRKTRKWAIMLAVLAYPLYYLAFGIAEGFRMPAVTNGQYPAVAWNDEKAGKQ